MLTDFKFPWKNGCHLSLLRPEIDPPFFNEVRSGMHTAITVLWEPEGRALWEDVSDNTHDVPSFGRRKKKHRVKRGMVALAYNPSSLRPSSATEWDPGQSGLLYEPCLSNKQTRKQTHKVAVTESKVQKSHPALSKLTSWFYVMGYNLNPGWSENTLLETLGSWARGWLSGRVQEKHPANWKQMGDTLRVAFWRLQWSKPVDNFVTFKYFLVSP